MQREHSFSLILWPKSLILVCPLRAGLISFAKQKNGWLAQLVSSMSTQLTEQSERKLLCELIPPHGVWREAYARFLGG